MNSLSIEENVPATSVGVNISKIPVDVLELQTRFKVLSENVVFLKGMLLDLKRTVSQLRSVYSITYS